MTLISFLFLFQHVIFVLMILISVAFFSLMERKVLSLIHYREGPNKVSLLGILQPFADAMKLITKDDFPVTWSNMFLFYMSPLLMLCVSLGTVVVLPFVTGSSHSLSMIVLMIFLGMTVYGVLISGWSSNSKYALIGSVRSVSQSLSYEVVLSFFMLAVMAVMASYDLMKFMDMLGTALVVMIPFMLTMFLLVALAELNRTPFDLSEAESELVSGYSVEYGGIMYTLIFLSENTSIFISCFMVSYFFFPKVWISFILPIVWVLWALILCVIRGVLPRLRYDVLMYTCWLSLLPGVLIGFNSMVILISL